MTEPHERFHDLMRLLVPINSLSPAHQDQLLLSGEILMHKKKEAVFRQGDRDGYAYYLLDGVLEMYADDQLIKRVEGGTGAAFQALAQLQPRQLTAIARTPVTVLRVDRALLERLLALEGGATAPAAAGVAASEAEDDDSGDWLAAVLQSELFARVPPPNIQRLLDSMESVRVKAGQEVIRQGDAGDYYYIVQQGRCEVLRRAANGEGVVRLAELGPGDSFGEEALVSNARRNATVRMLTDGELVRLTKEDFIELIQRPVLHGVSRAAAERLIAEGAQWLDVRQPEEHRENALPGSVNVPLNRLRDEVERLDRARAYVCYCDSGVRSSAAAFLLAERGFDARYVEGGTGDIPPPPAVKDTDEALEAEVRASALTAELARASLQLEEAKRLKEEAERARAEIERIVEERLRAERERIEEKARKAEEMLRAAQRLQAEIEAQKKRAEEEVEKRRRAEEERLQRLQAEAERRLRAEEARLQEVYRRNAEELERIEHEKAEAERRLAEERARIEAQSAETQQRLDLARQKEEALELEAQRLHTERQAREAELKEAARRTISAERRRLEAEFARTAEALEQARRERAAAEAARRAAAEEAERIIREFKARHEKLRAAEYAKLEAERERLRAEASKLAQALEQARHAKAEAERARREAEESRAQLAAAERPRAAAGGPVNLDAELEAIVARASAATERLREAEQAHARVEAARRENEARLERTYESQARLNEALQAELEEWIAEQEKLQSSTLGREQIRQQIAISERIKRQAELARSANAARDRSLLEEIEAQLQAED